MKLDASYDSDKNIVVVEAEGLVTTESVKAAVLKALELSKEHDCYDLLFDITKCKAGQSLVQAFEAMSNLQQTTGLTHKHKCAVVFDPATYPMERAQFVENVVATRPNPELRLYTNGQEATQWLKGMK